MQATVVGLLAAVAALLLGAVSKEELDFAKVELLCASSIITAFLAAFALGQLIPHPSDRLLLALSTPIPTCSALNSLCFNSLRYEK